MHSTIGMVERAKKVNPTKKLAEDAYCTAWLAQGIKGCDQVAFQSHSLCLVAGSGAYRCQSIYRNLYYDCMKGNLKCQKQKKDTNESKKSCDNN